MKYLLNTPNKFIYCLFLLFINLLLIIYCLSYLFIILHLCRYKIINRYKLLLYIYVDINCLLLGTLMYFTLQNSAIISEFYQGKE